MSKEIKRQKLVIIDDCGKERIVLQCSEGDKSGLATIRLNHEGFPVMEITCNLLGEAGIQFYARKGQPCLTIGINKD